MIWTAKEALADLAQSFRRRESDARELKKNYGEAEDGHVRLEVKARAYAHAAALCETHPAAKCEE